MYPGVHVHPCPRGNAIGLSTETGGCETDDLDDVRLAPFFPLLKIDMQWITPPKKTQPECPGMSL